jgi:hypothetical protein
MILSLARSPPIYLESINLDPLYRLDDEMRQIIRRHPLLEIRRQQEWLRPVKLPEIHHASASFNRHIRTHTPRHKSHRLLGVQIRHEGAPHLGQLDRIEFARA